MDREKVSSSRKPLCMFNTTVSSYYGIEHIQNEEPPRYNLTFSISVPTSHPVREALRLRNPMQHPIVTCLEVTLSRIMHILLCNIHIIRHIHTSRCGHKGTQGFADLGKHQEHRAREIYCLADSRQAGLIFMSILTHLRSLPYIYQDRMLTLPSTSPSPIPQLITRPYTPQCPPLSSHSPSPSSPSYPTLQPSPP